MNSAWLTRNGTINLHVGPLLARKLQRANMAKLTTQKKNAEPTPLPASPAQYPMPDASHARNAKARASQMEHQGKLSEAEKKKIDTKADRILRQVAVKPATP